MYPQVLDYGAIGKYDCDAKCDAEYGPEGNITFKTGQVSDYRGVFCFQRKVLTEANYDLLNFMYNAAARVLSDQPQSRHSWSATASTSRSAG